MNLPTSNSRRPVSLPGRLACALALALACAPGASAQMVVHDPIHQMQNVLTQLQQMGKDVAAYAAQAMRWQQQYSHYMQQLIRAKSMLTKIGLPQGAQLTPVADDYLVAERCGTGGGGFSLSTIKQMIALDPMGDLLQQQRQICVNIQVIENRKYNETVKLLKDTVPQLERTLGVLKQIRDLSNDKGNLDRAQYDSGALSVDMDRTFVEWKGRMDAYDSYLRSQQNTQKTLAQIALKGQKGDLLGTLVKTASLRTALKVGD